MIILTFSLLFLNLKVKTFFVLTNWPQKKITVKFVAKEWFRISHKSIVKLGNKMPYLVENILTQSAEAVDYADSISTED